MDADLAKAAAVLEGDRMERRRPDPAHTYRSTWDKVAREFGAEADAVIDRIRNLAARAGDAFADAVAVPDIAALGSSLPGRLVDLVAERSTRCTELLESSESRRF